MHPVIAFVAILAAILFFVIRARRAVREVRELDRDTTVFRHRAKGLWSVSSDRPCHAFAIRALRPRSR